ncbi:hypothetical protein MSUIS_07280 [Mycoplasma suis KI3806]|uniref:Uncharacterized protein n=1 Tax=Mycoplasma suis (strain KI_3806) TaxID=708248 RepID=F0V2E0_MYCS3|nr:hypothetical protein [Mycoplasma suis]CBZ40821.1 hypothetical protein MSUIS_07280 [Mycoplasma suis KI3806]
MRKISESEKKLIVGGAGRRRYSSLSSSKPKSGIVNCNTRFHNISLLALSSIPGLITLGEEIYSFFFGDKGKTNQVSSHFSPVGSGYYGSYSGEEAVMPPIEEISFLMHQKPWDQQLDSHLITTRAEFPLEYLEQSNLSEKVKY